MSTNTSQLCMVCLRLQSRWKIHRSPRLHLRLKMNFSPELWCDTTILAGSGMDPCARYTRKGLSVTNILNEIAVSPRCVQLVCAAYRTTIYLSVSEFLLCPVLAKFTEKFKCITIAMQTVHMSQQTNQIIHMCHSEKHDVICSLRYNYQLYTEKPVLNSRQIKLVNKIWLCTASSCPRQ